VHRIASVSREQYDRLVEIWEASVRATHAFLGESDIAFLRPKIRHEYLQAVALRAYEDDRGFLLGFVGVHDGNVEMLFVAPENRGSGVGAALLRHAVEQLGATSVDVNEQNPQAIGFYERMGFRPVGRSPIDGQGKPFPLIHMALAPPTGGD
jgi:putative acetyltransferase